MKNLQTLTQKNKFSKYKKIKNSYFFFLLFFAANGERLEWPIDT
jgi:hypothetical protein